MCQYHLNTTELGSSDYNRRKCCQVDTHTYFDNCLIPKFMNFAEFSKKTEYVFVPYDSEKYRRRYVLVWMCTVFLIIAFIFLKIFIMHYYFYYKCVL